MNCKKVFLDVRSESLSLMPRKDRMLWQKDVKKRPRENSPG